jgi:hypothetical protein
LYCGNNEVSTKEIVQRLIFAILVIASAYIPRNRASLARVLLHYITCIFIAQVIIQLLMGLALCMWAGVSVPAKFLSVLPHSEENR